RNARADRLRPTYRLELLDPAPTTVQITDDVAEILVRRHDLDGHDGLEELRLGALHALLEGHRAGDLERALARVDLVVRAVDQLDLDVDHRVAGDDARAHRFLDALVDSGDVLLGHAAADDLVDELVALGRVRVEVDDDVAVLPRAARLTD